MRDILIASFDMEIGGVERSLISMLDNFDYNNNNVDLMLYSHKGDFMNLINKKVNLLSQDNKYSGFRKSIGQLIKEGQITLTITRVMAKINSIKRAHRLSLKESSYIQMQLMWKYSISHLPKINKKYDVAISYLWPHYFIAKKVDSDIKIAWIHTDYSKLETDIEEDIKIWDKYDYIFAVSDECRNSFLVKYPILKSKVKVMENITSPEFVKKMADEDISSEIRNDSSFKIVSVGRLSYAKGIDNAVRALKILHNKGLSNIKWYVVGYGGDEAMIRRLIKENELEDSFILLGKKSNPYPYMKAADLYVQPSRYEGKAVTVTEAQILNKPVLITNYPTANSQVVEGYDGIICDLSIEGIAKEIENLFRNRDILKRLEKNCKISNYSNNDELKKLYKLVK